MDRKIAVLNSGRRGQELHFC